MKNRIMTSTRRNSHFLGVKKFPKNLCRGVFSQKKRIDNSWIGALSGKTKILGNIVAPVVEEGEWEVLSS
jgi:hypothetical protein